MISTAITSKSVQNSDCLSTRFANNRGLDRFIEYGANFWKSLNFGLHTAFSKRVHSLLESCVLHVMSYDKFLCVTPLIMTDDVVMIGFQMGIFFLSISVLVVMNVLISFVTCCAVQFVAS